MSEATPYSPSPEIEAEAKDFVHRAADAPQRDPHARTEDEVHRDAVVLLGEVCQRFGSHHPLTEHVRSFADRPSPDILTTEDEESDFPLSYGDFQ